MQNLLGKNMDRFINLFFYKHIELQESFQMVSDSSKFKNIGDYTLIKEKGKDNGLTKYSFELYIGDKKGTIENPFPDMMLFFQYVFGEDYCATRRVNKDGKSLEITIVYINE